VKRITGRIRAREGDFVESFEGLIFDVKGLVHPPDRVIAYVRYIPDRTGNRRRANQFYKKVYSLHERNKFLKEKYPKYLYFDPFFNQLLEGVPTESIYKHYKPEKKLREMRRRSESLIGLEKDAFEFIKLLKEKSGIPWEKIGVSGSILVDLYDENSDIDVVVYGSKNCIKVYETLKLLISSGNLIRRYDEAGLKKLYKFRIEGAKISFEQFIKTESRKVIQGEFKGRDYFIRFVKDWHEITEKYGEKTYMPIGRARIKARVVNDDEAIFTPCKYIIDDVVFLRGTVRYPLEEVVSFRGRFCEHAYVDERIIVEGTLEKVVQPNGFYYYRLIIGGDPKDFMIIAGDE